MRAWRTHEYGPRPTEVLRLDTVPVPEPEAGEVRVRVQAIPLNLNDLERINGGNMMARPDLPYSPGMEVMGVVDACGPGAEGWAGRRVVATTKGAHGGFAEYVICRRCRRSYARAIRSPAALYFRSTWRSSGCRPGRSAGRRAGADPRRGRQVRLGRDPAPRSTAATVATAGTDEKVAVPRLGADVAINYNRQDLPRSCSPHGDAASRSCSTTSVNR